MNQQFSVTGIVLVLLVLLLILFVGIIFMRRLDFRRKHRTKNIVPGTKGGA